jgi:hypothetical protein
VSICVSEEEGQDHITGLPFGHDGEARLDSPALKNFTVSLVIRNAAFRAAINTKDHPFNQGVSI